MGSNTPGAATQRGGFGTGLEGFWEGLGSQNCEKIEVFGTFWDMFFEISDLVDSCSIFDNFDGGDGESKPVTGVCHGEEDRKASDICV